MSKPTLPKPAKQERKSSARKRDKFRPANRWRSVGCGPMGTDKLIEKREVLEAATRYHEVK